MEVDKMRTIAYLLSILFIIGLVACTSIESIDNESTPDEVSNSTEGLQASPKELILAEQPSARYGISYYHPQDWFTEGIHPNVFVIMVPVSEYSDGGIASVETGHVNQLSSNNPLEAIKDFIPKRDDFSVLLVPTLHEVNGQQIVKAIYNKDEVNHLLLLALIINQGRYAVVEMASSASADESLPEDLSQDNINEITQSTTGKLFEVIVGGIQVDEPTGPMPLETGENRQDRLWNIGFETFYRYTSPEKQEIKITVEGKEDFFGQPKIRLWDAYTGKGWPSEDDPDSFVNTNSTLAETPNYDAENETKEASLTFMAEPGVTYLIGVRDDSSFPLRADYEISLTPVR